MEFTTEYKIEFLEKRNYIVKDRYRKYYHTNIFGKVSLKDVRVEYKAFKVDALYPVPVDIAFQRELEEALMKLK